MRHACKTCETIFAPTGPSGLGSAIVSSIILGLFALLSLGAHVLVFAFFVGLIALRWWLYMRSGQPVCPSCRSRDCVSIETPVGRKILDSAPAPVADKIDFKAATPEEQAILDDERRARAAFNRR